MVKKNRFAEDHKNREVYKKASRKSVASSLCADDDRETETASQKSVRVSLVPVLVVKSTSNLLSITYQSLQNGIAECRLAVSLFCRYILIPYTHTLSLSKLFPSSYYRCCIPQSILFTSNTSTTNGSILQFFRDTVRTIILMDYLCL